jgi:hypothetical protein
MDDHSSLADLLNAKHVILGNYRDSDIPILSVGFHARQLVYPMVTSQTVSDCGQRYTTSDDENTYSLGSVYGYASDDPLSVDEP